MTDKIETNPSLIPSLICGVELEMEYNRDLLGYISRNGYHTSEDNKEMFGENFYAEEDGSLQPQEFCSSDGEEECPDCNGQGCDNCNDGYITNENEQEEYVVELISKPFNIDNYKTILTDFQNELYQRIQKNNPKKTIEELKKQYELKDLVCFNSTCGSHIHLSCLNQAFKRNKLNVAGNSFKGKHIFLRGVLYLNFIKQFRELLEKRVKEQLPQIYDKWQPYTERHFARRITSIDRLQIAKRERYSEWNLSDEKRGLEYRSFNLLGIKKWSEFFTIWDIVMTTLKEVFMQELTKKQPFSQTKTRNITALKNKTIKKALKFEKEIEQRNIKTIENIKVEVKTKCAISI